MPLTKPGPSRREPSLGQPVEFLRLLWAVDHALRKSSKRMARSHRVTGPQRLAIRIIGKAPDISAGELARILCLDPSTLTGVLKRLVARRLVVSRHDPADRRRARLSLTPAGRERDRRSKGTVEAGVRRTLAGLTAHEVQTAGKVLKELAAVLTEQSQS